MNFEIVCKPDYAAVRVQLSPGEKIVTEAGAMMSMSTNLEMETNMRGGLGAALKRKMMGGESLFQNTYTCKDGEGRIEIAPSTPGDLVHLELDGSSPVILQSGAYVASTEGIELDSKWGGAKTFFGGEGLFMLEAKGQGHLFFGSYGAIHEVDVDGGYVVDTGHIVGFERSLDFDVRTVGDLRTSIFSGEGLVCEFRGRGKLWIQTRAGQSMAEFLHPFRAIQQKKS